MLRHYRLMAVLALAAAPAAWAADSASFSLGKAVPQDVFIYVHGAYNPEAKYLHEYWSEVWTAFRRSGVIEDVHKLIASNAAPADQERFEKFWQRASELIDGVDWDARIEEVVYTSRMGAPMPEFLLLLRYENGEKAAKNAGAFSAVLDEIHTATGSENGGLTLSDQEAHGAKIHTLTAKDAAFVNLRVAVRESVVAIAMDRGMLDESLALLAGEEGTKGLIQSQRYTQAMAKLPPAEDALVFFDIQAMLGGLHRIFDYALAMAPQNQSQKDAFGVFGKVVDEFGMFDYMATTTHTDGYRQFEDSIVTMTADASKSRLYKVFGQPKAIEKFDRFIPKEAASYSVSTGVDLGALYGAALDFLGKEVPGGEDLVTRWDGVQEQIGFNAQRDLFDWLGAQMITVQVPAAQPTSLSPTETVFFLKVRDEKMAAAKIKAGLDKLNQLLMTRQMPLTSRPADIPGTTGFRSISVNNPMLAMLVHPVYGTADGYLVIGSSASAIEACLATSRGEHASVAKNERVVREGLIPKGAVTSASFSDLTSLGKNISQGLGMVGMFAMFIPPDQPEAQPVRAIFSILSKLSPVAQKLDFFVSTSEVTTFEKNTWHSQKVTNYRQPTAKAESTATLGS